MRHAKVTQTPSETCYDLLPGSCERICAECSYAIAKSTVICSVEVTYSVHDDRYCEKCDEHHEALEKVCPANGLITAQECVDEDQYCEDDHSEVLVISEVRQY